jgi:zinc transport system substrate-binding protein
MRFLRFFFTLTVLITVAQGKSSVIASVYPLYDFVSIIAGSEISVDLLIPPNGNPHSFEPSPKDIVNLSNADLFFYISPEFEPWAEKFGRKAKLTIRISEDEHRHNDIQNNEGHDPHIWLDIEEVVEIIGKVTENLCRIIPKKKVFFEGNAENLISQIESLDKQYKTVFENCGYKKVFFAGHNSFTEFAKRYGLQFVPITQSYSSLSEPSAKQVAKIIDEIKNSDVKFVYYDALSNVTVAKTIAKETKTQILPLYSIHSTSKDDFEKKIHYIEYMKRNYENLAKGLQCPQ